MRPLFRKYLLEGIKKHLDPDHKIHRRSTAKAPRKSPFGKRKQMVIPMPELLLRKAKAMAHARRKTLTQFVRELIMREDFDFNRRLIDAMKAESETEHLDPELRRMLESVRRSPVESQEALPPGQMKTQDSEEPIDQEPTQEPVDEPFS